MMPIAPLMIEHRLIERMVRRIGLERLKLQRGGELDAVFLLEAIDFMRAYADRCHHGKEEDILFNELKIFFIGSIERKKEEKVWISTAH